MQPFTVEGVQNPSPMLLDNGVFETYTPRGAAEAVGTLMATVVAAPNEIARADNNDRTRFMCVTLTTLSGLVGGALVALEDSRNSKNL